MANPKYAGLPGIAPPDEKDVYETDDLPEVDQDAEFLDEPETEFIERPHISIGDAHNRFKDKVLIGGKNLDFSDRLRRRRQMGYQSVSGDWEIAAEGEKETLLQKYNRLQCEMKELLEEVAELKKKSANEQTEEVLLGLSLQPQLEEAQRQLNNLNLNESLGSDLVNSISDPQGTLINKLLSQFDSLKQSGSKSGKGSSAQVQSDINVLTYHLKNLPEQRKLQQSARITDLEQRLKQLETVIGADTDSFNRLKSTEYQNLFEAANDLGARVSLLDPSQLDRVETKLSAVASRMDTIVDKRGGAEYRDKDTKINELYDLLQKTEALGKTLPPIIDRLIALKVFQKEAGAFRKSLSEYESNNKTMAVDIAQNEALLKKTQESLEKHLAAITESAKSLDARLQALKK